MWKPNPLQAISFTGWLIKEVVHGAYRNAHTVFTPGENFSPAIVELPVHAESDLEVSLLAAAITITPGTITIGIAPAEGDTPTTLYVHSMYCETPEELREELYDMEHHLLTVTRGKKEADKVMAGRAGPLHKREADL